MAHNLITVTPSDGSGAITLNEYSIVYAVEASSGGDMILRVITGQNVEKNIQITEDATALATLMRFPLSLELVSNGLLIVLNTQRILTVETYGADSIVKVLGLKEKKFIVDETPTAIKTLVNDLVNPDLP